MIRSDAGDDETEMSRLKIVIKVSNLGIEVCFLPNLYSNLFQRERGEPKGFAKLTEFHLS